VIARKRVDTVLTPDNSSITEAEVTEDPQDMDTQSVPGDAAKPKSQVPVWRQGLAWSALSVDYQRILTALAHRARLGQGPMTCQELATGIGMGLVPARVEALRSKAKRLVARGRAVEPTPGRFTLARGVSRPGGGS
jgi:hypothetical protein